MKKVLKNFDVEKAKAGAKIVTRNGKSVRIVCWDMRGNDCPIVALISYGGSEYIQSYKINGNFYLERDYNENLMLEESEFEDGDILSCQDGKVYDVMILKEINENYPLSYYFHVILSYNGYLGFNDCLAEHDYKLATEGEKQKLFDALAKKGKRWNAEKKVIEDVKEENKYEFKRGQAVLVKDDDNAIWYPAIFIDYNSYCDYVYPFITTKGTYKMCIDYDSNRDLLYQFDNPE